MLEDFLKDINNIYNEIVGGNIPKLVEFKDKWGIIQGIGEAYEGLSKRENKKERGGFYTPTEVVKYMVGDLFSSLDYSANPKIRILDPSCGGGYFLTELYDRLVIMAGEMGIENPEKYVLDNNIFGYDTDENAVMISVIELYERSGHIAKNILRRDFLMDDCEGFDTILGNPPYMGHKVLSPRYREKLAQKYKDVFSDKGDISYCFIKKAVECLVENGILVFFTSRYILEALNAKDIRNYILGAGRMERVIDFYGVRIIKGVGVDNIILKFSKYPPDEEFEFYRVREGGKNKGTSIFDDIRNRTTLYTKYITIKSSELDKEGWVFLSPIEKSILDKIKGVELSNICEAYQGIITGCDDAFVLSYDDAHNLGIEEDLLKPWIKNKNVRRYEVLPSNQVLIYSDLIPSEEDYPKAISQISKYREGLRERRECKKGLRKWYELQWGRKQAIFEGNKIVFPYKASSNRFAIDKGNYYSADVYALVIKPMFERIFTYEYLLGLLNSSIYEFYIKSMAKKLGDDLYDYYPNKIMTLRIPEPIAGIEEEIKKGGKNLHYVIDMILSEELGISLEEYSVIRSWCS